MMMRIVAPAPGESTTAIEQRPSRDSAPRRAPKWACKAATKLAEGDIHHVFHGRFAHGGSTKLGRGGPYVLLFDVPSPQGRWVPCRGTEPAAAYVCSWRIPMA